MTASRDAVIVGGGHNGLVAAAYLARSGLDTLVCERRDVVGGAAVSEHPFGPDYTVTSLSYVVSLLAPDLVRDLRLASHGYHVFPQGPYFAPRADGRYLRLPHEPAARRAEIAKFSARTRLPMPATRRTWPGSVRFSARCSTRYRPGSAPGGRRICCGRGCCFGTCASWTRAARSTSPGCSPAASPTWSSATSRPTPYGACWQYPA